VKVKVDGSTVRIGFGDDTQTVLEVLDICAFFESFQVASSRETHVACQGDGRKSAGSSPKKWPASVDLQASKKSKGLQEQQTHRCYFNTPALRSLTISTPEFILQTPNSRVNMRLRACTTAKENDRNGSASRLEIAGIAQQTAA
jgi:hypothetical protein